MSGANDRKCAPATTTTTTTITSTTLACKKTEDKTNNNLGHAGLSPLLISAAPSSPLPSSASSLPSSASSLPSSSSSSSSSTPTSLRKDGPEADELDKYWALKSRLNVVYDALFPSLRVTTASPRHDGGASSQSADHVHQWAEYQALRSRCLEAAAKVSMPPPAARVVPPSPAPAAPSPAPAAPSPDPAAPSTAPAAPWSSRWALPGPARDYEAEYAADFPPLRVTLLRPSSQSLSRPEPSKSRRNNGGGGASWRTTGKWNACPELMRFRCDGPETTAVDYTETSIPSLQYIADEIFTCPYHTCTPNCTGLKACRSLGLVHLKKFHPICSRRDTTFGREKPKPWCHREEAKQIRFHETFKPSKKN